MFGGNSEEKETDFTIVCERYHERNTDCPDVRQLQVSLRMEFGREGMSTCVKQRTTCTSMLHEICVCMFYMLTVVDYDLLCE